MPAIIEKTILKFCLKVKNIIIKKIKTFKYAPISIYQRKDITENKPIKK